MCIRDRIWNHLPKKSGLLDVLELLYINKSVGIGEHPDIVEVLDNYMNMLENNTSKLESLQKLFSAPKTTESN